MLCASGNSMLIKAEKVSDKDTFFMTYLYTNKETNEVLEVPIERWCWGAVYNDGTELKQFGDDGVFHRIGEIDQEKLVMFVMYKPDSDARIDLPFTEGMRLIHHYYNFHDQSWEDIQRTVRIYGFGYKKAGQLHYTFILPDDRLIVSDRENVDFSKFNII